MKKLFVLNFILFFITIPSLFAKSKDIFITHGGRLNSGGCHNYKMNNSYHCHNKNSQRDKIRSNKKK